MRTYKTKHSEIFAGGRLLETGTFPKGVKKQAIFHVQIGDERL